MWVSYDTRTKNQRRSRNGIAFTWQSISSFTENQNPPKGARGMSDHKFKHAPKYMFWLAQLFGKRIGNGVYEYRNQIWITKDAL